MREPEGISFKQANQVELSRRGSIWVLKWLWTGFMQRWREWRSGFVNIFILQTDQANM